MIDREAIKARLAAVPPPPWGEFCESGDWWIGPQDEDGGPRDEAAICNSGADDMSQEVADFITAAPQDITDLLAENEQLAAQLQFILSRIEDNSRACEVDPTERGWRATFTYEETVTLRCLIDPVFAQQVQAARVGAILERTGD